MSSAGDWLFKLIGIVVLTLHDYLRYWISRRPRRHDRLPGLRRMSVERLRAHEAARRRRRAARRG